MANFIQVDSTNLGQTYLNIDNIVCMSYVQDKDHTIVFTSDSDIGLRINGDCTSAIINKNNDVSMHDKLLCNYFIAKIKGYFSNIISDVNAIRRKLSNGD